MVARRFATGTQVSHSDLPMNSSVWRVGIYAGESSREKICLPHSHFLSFFFFSVSVLYSVDKTCLRLRARPISTTHNLLNDRECVYILYMKRKKKKKRVREIGGMDLLYLWLVYNNHHNQNEYIPIEKL